ncbi:MAG TPA: hypothetical protein VGN12_19945 [Pirellulales bacterium]
MAVGSAGCRPTADQSKTEQSNGIAITASSTEVGLSGGDSWYLNVNPAGVAELMINSVPVPKTRQFRISQEWLDAFRAAVVQERFFDLDDDYGQIVPDGSTDTLTLTQGDESKTVRIHFLMNWLGDPSKLRDPCRAVRLFMMLRGWFDDSDAVDLRKYDQRVLDSIEK